MWPRTSYSSLTLHMEVREVSQQWLDLQFDSSERSTEFHLLHLSQHTNIHSQVCSPSGISRSLLSGALNSFGRAGCCLWSQNHSTPCCLHAPCSMPLHSGTHCWCLTQTMTHTITPLQLTGVAPLRLPTLTDSTWASTSSVLCIPCSFPVLNFS